MLLSLLLAAGAAQAAAPLGDPGAVVVEETVAVLRSPAGAAPRVLTLTRLEEEARIVLASKGAVEAALRPIDRPTLRATLGWVIDQLLLADEAARLRVDEVSREEVLLATRRFEARFADRTAYERFLAGAELTEEEVASVLARGLRVDRYLAIRVGRGPAVADADVDAYAASHGLSVQTRAAREAVRSRLLEERVAAQVQALVAEVRGRADVRILDPALAPGAGEG
ncbi:MAG: hypothetical protein QM767_15480 [Anaeromyxobacter sp.]